MLTVRIPTNGLRPSERLSASQLTCVNLRAYLFPKRTITLRASSSCSSCKILPMVWSVSQGKANDLVGELLADVQASVLQLKQGSESPSVLSLRPSPNSYCSSTSLHPVSMVRVHTISSDSSANLPLPVRRSFVQSINRMLCCSSLSTGFYCFKGEERPSTLGLSAPILAT